MGHPETAGIQTSEATLSARAQVVKRGAKVISYLVGASLFQCTELGLEATALKNHPNLTGATALAALAVDGACLAAAYLEGRSGWSEFADYVDAVNADITAYLEQLPSQQGPNSQ